MNYRLDTKGPYVTKERSLLFLATTLVTLEVIGLISLLNGNRTAWAFIDELSISLSERM